MVTVNDVVLTDREVKMLRLIASGRTYASIATEIGITFETCRKTLKRIRDKLGLRSKSALAVWAVRNLEIKA